MRIRDRLINKSQGIEIKLFGKYFTKSFSKFENTKLFLGWVKHERYITTCCRCNKNEVFFFFLWRWHLWKCWLQRDMFHQDQVKTRSNHSCLVSKHFIFVEIFISYLIFLNQLYAVKNIELQIKTWIVRSPGVKYKWNCFKKWYWNYFRLQNFCCFCCPYLFSNFIKFHIDDMSQIPKLN